MVLCFRAFDYIFIYYSCYAEDCFQVLAVFVPGDLFFVLFNSYLLIVSKNNKVIERKGIFIHVNKLLTYTLFLCRVLFLSRTAL